MSRVSTKPKPRRAPQQRRAKDTVDAVLEGVARVLRRDGVDAVTTNRIAVAAGVSVGSVYQYFPDKRAIFRALHDRHAEQVARALETALVENAAASIDTMLGALVDALIDAHADDPRFYELLASDVPYGSDGTRGSDSRLRSVLRLALAPRVKSHDLDRVLFVLTPMIDALAHAVVLKRPARMSRVGAKAEVMRAIRAYLRA